VILSTDLIHSPGVASSRDVETAADSECSCRSAALAAYICLMLTNVVTKLPFNISKYLIAIFESVVERERVMKVSSPILPKIGSHGNVP